MLKLLLNLPFMGVSLLWSGPVSSEIQPLRLVSVSEPLVAIERARPADRVASGEKDVEVSRSPLLESHVPPVDFDRIAEIRQAIGNGTYRLDPARIADALIASVQAKGNDQ